MQNLENFEATVQPHPLTAGRKTISAPAGQSVSDIIRTSGVLATAGIPRAVIHMSGKSFEVPIAMWPHTRPKAGARLDVGFDSPEGPAIGAVLSAVISASAGSIAGFVFPSLAAGSIGMSLATTAITVLGGLAVSALIAPPEQPKAAALERNYIITGTANAANPYGTYPKVVGRRRMFPPKSAGGYSEQIGKTAYWRGRFCFGWGPVYLEDIRIGSTPITEFDDVQIEFLNIDEDRTLAAHTGLDALVFDSLSERHFPISLFDALGDSYTFSPRGAAATVALKFTTFSWLPAASMEIEAQSRVVPSGSWVTEQVYPETSSGDRVWTSPTYSDGLRREFRLIVTDFVDAPEQENASAQWLFETISKIFETKVTEAFCEYQLDSSEPGWRTGTEVMQLYQDDVFEEVFDVLLEKNDQVVRFTQTNTEEVGVDLTFKYGVYDGNTKNTNFDENWAVIRFEYRRYGDTAWISAGQDITFTAKSKTSYRVSHNILFPSSGEWEVRMMRVNDRDTDDPDENRIWLTGLRSFQTRNLPSFDGVAEIAIRLKATDQLNGQIENLNAIVHQLAPVWDGASWGSPEPVRHPAWVLADWLRGDHSSRPVEDHKIDLDAFKAWADEEPHWTCDFVFDTDTRMIEGARLIAAAGRATMALPDMRYSVIRDGGAGPVRQIFTPRNSWGFSSDISYRRELHGLRILFRSERKNWQQEEVTIYLDGFDENNASEFETLELEGVVLDDGVTDLGNVYKLGHYHLAQAVLRPETFEWKADFENLRVTRGDKVRVVNDVVKLGHGQGRVRSISGATITLDDRFALDVGEDYRLTVRAGNGDLIVLTAELTDILGSQWLVSSGDTSGIATGDLVIVEETEIASYDLLVTGVFPASNLTASITATNAAPEVLTAGTGPLPAFDPAITDPVELFGPPPPVPTLVYSGEDTSVENPSGSVTGRVGILYSNISTFEPYLVRLRWSADGGKSWTVGEAQPPNSTALTDGIPAGESVIVEIRTESLTGVTRGWVRAGTQSVLAIGASYPNLIDFTAIPTQILKDAESRLAIQLGWSVVNAAQFHVTWQVRLKDGAIIDAGRSVPASAGVVYLTEGILPRTEHEVRASFTDVENGTSVWTGWVNVITGSSIIRALDLGSDVQALIDNAAQSAEADKAAAEAAALASSASEIAAGVFEDAAGVHAAAAVAAATDAGDFSSSAHSSQVLVAEIARDMLPSTIDDTGLNFNGGTWGDPRIDAPLTPANYPVVSFPTSDVARLTMDGTAVAVRHNGFATTVVGRTYRFAVEVRQVAGTVKTDAVQLYRRRWDNTFTNQQSSVVSFTVSALNVWEYFEIDYENTGHTNLYYSPFLYFPTSVNVSGDVFEVRYVALEDVTGVVEADASASAAATSEALAAAHETASGQNAAASDASRVAAETAKSASEAARTQSVTSASDANSSAADAADSATLSTTSKNASEAAATASSDSASTSSTKAGEAAVSAAAASASKTSAEASFKAQAISSSLQLPSTFQEDGLHFTSNYNTAPENTSGLSSSWASYTDDSGPVMVVDAASVHRTFGQRGVHVTSVGRTYRLRMEVKQVSGAVGPNVAGFLRRFSDGYASSVDVLQTHTISALNTWETFEHTYTNNGHSNRNLRALVRFELGGVYHIRVLAHEDITGQLASETAASAANTSATTASAFADAAGASASAANVSKLASETAKSAAQVSESNAALSETSAEGSASSALASKEVSAKLISDGMAKNPVFSDWDGTLPANITVGLTEGTATKNTGGALYENSIILETAVTPTASHPYLVVRSAEGHTDGSQNAADIEMVEVTIELEKIGGDWGGCSLVARWEGDNHYNVRRYLSDYLHDTNWQDQKLTLVIERPTDFSSAVQDNGFTLVFYTTSSSGYLYNRVRVHKLTYKVISATASAGLTQKAVTTVDGWSESMLAMSATAGGANGEIRVYAMDDLASPVSGITMKADYYTFEGGLLMFDQARLRSSNFVPNVSGWQITEEGDAQFNDLVVTGSMIALGAVEARKDMIKLTTTAVGEGYVDVVEIALPSSFESASIYPVICDIRARFAPRYFSALIPHTKATKLYWRLQAKVSGVWTFVDGITTYHDAGITKGLTNPMLYTNSFNFSNATDVKISVKCDEGGAYPGNNVDIEYIIADLRQTKRGG